jgi:CRP-like cAMP-binding protein
MATINRDRQVQLKTKAEKYAQDGKWRKALELFEELQTDDPKNDRLMRRIGDMHFRMGDKSAAKSCYKKLADLYARNGFWAKAISTNKLVLELDPSDQEIQQSIVKLYSNMGIQSVPPKPRGDSPTVSPTISNVNEKNMDYYVSCVDLENEDPEVIEVGETLAPVPIPKVVPKPASKVTPKPVVGSGHLDFSSIPKEPESLFESVVELDDEVIQLEETTVSRERIRVPLFSDFGPHELTEILQHLSVRKVPADVLLCDVGQRGDSMYIIASGNLEVSVKNSKGEKNIIAHLSTGEFFGEFGLLSDGKRHATVITKTPSELLEITKNDFREISEKFPKVLAVLDRHYRNRLVDTILSQNELFKDLMRDERQAFITRFELRKIPTNTVLFREGDESGDLYFVKSGSLEVSIRRERDIIVIAHLSSGDFFGEIALLNNQKRTATIRAAANSEVLLLQKAVANEILH